MFLNAQNHNFIPYTKTDLIIYPGNIFIFLVWPDCPCDGGARVSRGQTRTGALRHRNKQRTQRSEIFSPELVLCHFCINVCIKIVAFLFPPSGIIVNDLLIRERLAAPEKSKMLMGMLKWNVLGREDEIKDQNK